MSITVPIGDLPATLARFPWGYLVTVGDDQRAHLLAVPTDWREGALWLAAGATTRSNAAVRPRVTVVLPPPVAGEYSLIIDGVADVDGETVRVLPSSAVLHRPAIT